MQSELATACAAHATALAQHDGRAQLETAQRFAELETDLLCAEAAAGAARALRQEGQPTVAREAAARRETRRTLPRRPDPPAMAPAEELVELTESERDTATVAGPARQSPRSPKPA